MVKVTTPFLSLSSSGSLGSSITTQKHGSQTIIRSKPFPAYRYTLPQAYQRWLYEDYSYLWHQQLEATKQSCARLGARRHLTAFQYWMSLNLKFLPDILAWWKLDDNLGPTVKDSSRNSNTGTVYGASGATGLIDKALYFDGTNDYISSPATPNWNFPGDFSLELLIYPELLNRNLLKSVSNEDWTLTATNDWIFDLGNTGKLAFYIKNVLAFEVDPALTINTWYHTLLKREAGLISIFINGVLALPTYANTTSIGNTQPLQIARNEVNLDNPYKGIIDNVIIRNRSLDQTEITRHSARRYPPTVS